MNGMEEKRTRDGGRERRGEEMIEGKIGGRVI